MFSWIPSKISSKIAAKDFMANLLTSISSSDPTIKLLALPISSTCQDLMAVCYVFIWTEPLHLVTGYHQPIHSLAKIKSSNYSLTNQGCFGFFFFQKVLNSINSSLTRNGKGLISRIIVLLLQFAVFKFSCWLDWKFYDIAYETSLTEPMLWSGIVLQDRTALPCREQN